LINAGADHRLLDSQGRSALMVAAQLGLKDIVEALLSVNAELENLNSQKRSALMEAVKYGRTSIVQVLI
jgi:ankyrin repeat protein